MQQESDFFAGVLKIALGLFLGSLLVWMTMQYYARYQIRQLNQVVQASMQDLQQQAVRAAARRLEVDKQRKQQELEQRQAVYQRQQAVQIAERQKQAAWAAFFQPSSQCLNDATVECGNAHMRARKEFERRYAAGEL